MSPAPGRRDMIQGLTLGIDEANVLVGPGEIVGAVTSVFGVY